MSSQINANSEGENVPMDTKTCHLSELRSQSMANQQNTHLANRWRTDFVGIDNGALDFSQLEDYINDDGDGNESIFHTGQTYFTESLITDLKGFNQEDSQRSNRNLRNHQTSDQVAVNANQLYPHDSSNQLNNNNNSPTSGQGLQSQHPQTVPVYNKSSNPHHLPESPPDSGSEPPYSPTSDENRVINGNHQVNSTPIKQRNSPEMMQTKSIERGKHFNHYSNTQLRHTSDMNLTHMNSSQSIANLAHPHHPLTNPIPSQHDEQMIAHLNESIIVNQLAVHNPVHSLPNPAHLTPLYQPSLVNDDYLTRGSTSATEGLSEKPPHVRPIEKKRKISESPKSSSNPIHVKPEPLTDSGLVVASMEDDYGFDYNSGADGPSSVYLDSAYQCIRFQPFQQSSWHVLCDSMSKELPTPNYRVDADKGFNFSNADDAFVCQKKNHFQVTVHVQAIGEPRYVNTCDGLKKIDNFYLHFYGVKVESPTQTIKVEQSQSDRSKKPFYPVLIELTADQVSKTTVGRLHFSETTSNNMRKKGKPNPDQRYFYLAVSLFAHVGDETYLIISHASERIIVRASNPGQFENDMELSWQKGHTPESIYHAGRVGVNTDRPDESLVVHGNVKVTGHIIQPSDVRAKTNVEEMNTREQLKNVSNIRVVRYQFTPEFAAQVGIKEEELNGTGVIAQEVRQILPDAVKEEGDVILPNGDKIERLLVVNKDRIFMENVGAVKELCKVTDSLETRIDELERVNKKLRKISRFDSIKSILSTSTSTSTVTCSSNYSENCDKLNYKLPHQNGHRRKCIKHKSSGEEHVCTNRLMQCIIMILVFVMAFCLASIVTLYILETPRRHNHILDPSSHSREDIFQNSLNNQSNPSSLPSSWSPSLSVSPTLQSRSSTESITSRSGVTESSDYEISRDQSKTSPRIQRGRNIMKDPLRPKTSIPILKPKVLGEPVECLTSPKSLPNNCGIHCCLDVSHQQFQTHRENHKISVKELRISKGESDEKSTKKSKDEDKTDSTLETGKLTESYSKAHSTSGSSPPSTTSVIKMKPINEPVSDEVSPYQSPEKLDNRGNLLEPSSRSSKFQDDSAATNQESSLNNTGGQIKSQGNGSVAVDTIDQNINSEVHLTESFIENNKFSSFTNKHPPKQSTEYSRAEEYREKREAVNSKDAQLKSHHSTSQFKQRLVRSDLIRSIQYVKLLELNATIGLEFCTTWQCVQEAGPSFTYLVPLSKFMPHEFVTIQFSLQSPLKVDHCQHQDRPMSCPSTPPEEVPHSYHRPEEHLPIKETSHNFRIPIGLYLRSSYVFRILSNEKDIDTPCSLSQDEIGSSFLEYKFIFQRECEK